MARAKAPLNDYSITDPLPLPLTKELPMTVTLEPLAGANLYAVLQQAVEMAPAKFTFNGWDFETTTGESFREACRRFKKEHGIEPQPLHQLAAEAANNLTKQVIEQAAKIKEAGVPTEAELKETKPPKCKTIEEVTEYINSMVNRPHDYGTCVYAMSLSALAALEFVAHKLGVTGFQYSCAGIDIICHTHGVKFGKLVNYGNLLYPQYCDKEHFPGLDELLADPEIKEYLAKLAKEKLAEYGTPGLGLSATHPDVLAHWQKLADG